MKRYDNGEHKKNIPNSKQIVEFMRKVELKKLKGKKRRRESDSNESDAKKKKTNPPSPLSRQGSSKSSISSSSPSITPADTPIASPSQNAKDIKAKMRAEHNARVVKDRFAKVVNKLLKKKWKFGKVSFNPFAIQITRENCLEVGVPGYFDVIEEAIDLTTIKKRLNELVYVSHDLLARDVRLLVKNAQTYNRENDAVYKYSQWISKMFEKDYVKLAKELDDEKAARKERKRLAKLEKLKKRKKVAELSRSG